ncbi:hypothetical protein CK203_038426 [Vitis vinifera]|uniref:EF-hand domain-containing protein n=1 Tax=Vitis vinifera TaxID=29760 RepID=A0A438IRY5_VITVI|nr:hypothetical protein CK203_038426 [Vitis vinifera]
MEEIREAALAYYEAGTQEQRQLARAFFQTLDVDGDGIVSVQEFVDFLRGRGYRLLDNPSFFQALDRDGNGCLDFYEVLTLYYIIKSGRPFCDGCGVFLKGLFFTCLDCYESSHTTFNLCSACYRGKRFSHQHAAILDNYTLLTHKRTMTMSGLGQPNMSQITSPGSSSLKRGKSSHEKVKEAFEAFDTAVTIGTYATYAANVCSIM